MPQSNHVTAAESTTSSSPGAAAGCPRLPVEAARLGVQPLDAAQGIERATEPQVRVERRAARGEQADPLTIPRRDCRSEVGVGDQVGVDDDGGAAVDPGLRRWPSAPAVPSSTSSTDRCTRPARWSSSCSRPWWTLTAMSGVTVADRVDRPVDEGDPRRPGRGPSGRSRVSGESRVPPPAASTIPARLSGMETRRWVNPSQPQTLQIAVFLLYINAFFSVLGGLPRLDPLGPRPHRLHGRVAASASRTSRSGATGSGSPPRSRPSLLRWLFLGPSHVFGAQHHQLHVRGRAGRAAPPPDEPRLRAHLVQVATAATSVGNDPAMTTIIEGIDGLKAKVGEHLGYSD